MRHCADTPNLQLVLCIFVLGVTQSLKKFHLGKKSAHSWLQYKFLVSYVDGLKAAPKRSDSLCWGLVPRTTKSHKNTVDFKKKEKKKKAKQRRARAKKSINLINSMTKSEDHSLFYGGRGQKLSQWVVWVHVRVSSFTAEVQTWQWRQPTVSGRLPTHLVNDRNCLRNRCHIWIGVKIFSLLHNRMNLYDWNFLCICVPSCMSSLHPSSC